MTKQQATAPRKRRRGAWIAGGSALVVLLAGGYVGAAAMTTDTVPRGTTVDGVPIGTLDGADAQLKANNAARAKVAKAPPITVAAGGKSFTINPAQAGLGYDAAGTVDGLTGFSLSPTVVWHHLTGGGPQRTLKPTVDKEALAAAVSQAGQVIKGAPVNGSVKFVNGKVQVVRSTPGKGVNAAALADQIAAGWPRTTAYTAPISEQEAVISNADIDRYLTSFANPAMSAPVKVVVGGRSASLTPANISAVLSTKVVGGELQGYVDQAKLASVLDSMSPELATPPVNAHYQGDQIVAEKDGSTVDPTGADKLLLAALTSPSRTMTLAAKPAKAEVTSAMLKKSPPGDELMSEFVSNFPTAPKDAARTRNIRVALAKINGMVVAPGEQFSLLNALLPIDAANGYVNAPVLVNGVDELGMGGGISQVSTTLYNATFFAGLQLDQHTAHAYWIPRYPMGREATLWDPTIDNKWTNDSGSSIRIRAGIEGHAAVIRLYGKKVFTVSSSTGKPFNIKPPKTQTVKKKGCIPQPPMDGFSVTVTRVVSRGGVVVKNEALTTTYIPADKVVCTNP
ncbi:hypothetical protein G9U51_04690 [Calidifontibacter sp. DB0510]|uniref:YoaR-like putative peptidoglycan binding domain-containing protein n=1 Tax=Metallococcus carri TaxID=1656884 RepID=A0A967E9Q6_9MICO|nr:VanW family protein [Metallococcus carri]NHN55084.1 hypothetical protein [Metallococcus carri]NOP36161.1 hypothetical protein [Calidifontibacter sp. DB2511S]